jgi:hypothetical protein
MNLLTGVVAFDGDRRGCLPGFPGRLSDLLVTGRTPSVVTVAVLMIGRR